MDANELARPSGSARGAASWLRRGSIGGLVRTAFRAALQTAIAASAVWACVVWACVVWACVDGGALRAVAQTPMNAADADRPDAKGAALLLGLETAVAEAIERAERSVVAIARERPRGATRLDESGTSFFQERGPDDPEFVPHEFGTGVVLDRSGLIVTTQHVVGDPKKNRYWVWVNRRPFPAEVLASDPWLDLAVLKIAADDLTPIVFAEYKGVRKGQFVISLGNPYAIARDGSPSAAWGMVSNLSRKAPPTTARAATQTSGETLHQFGTLIQVDSRLQRGTSGGAIVNLQGEMIGLTTALAALEGHEAQGGFAIPVDETFKRVVELLKKGRQPDYGFLGIGPELLPLEQRQRGEGGVRVRQIVAGTPAAKSDLRMGDLITHVADQRIWDGTDLIRELSRRPAGEEVDLVVLRSERGGSTAAPAGAGGATAPSKVQRIKVELAKKYIGGGSWPPFALESPPLWRGLRVDYATAIARFEEHASELDEAGCLAIVEVQPNSPAWKAGLRPGMFVSHVDQHRLERPRDFDAATQDRSGEVPLRIVGAKGADAIRVVAP